jgi:hypothetical protein
MPIKLAKRVALSNYNIALVFVFSSYFSQRLSFRYLHFTNVIFCDGATLKFRQQQQHCAAPDVLASRRGRDGK